MKTHACQWPGCHKSFTRAEHLRRHALNHEQARNGFTCERCSVHFHRPDLLSRHMMRHAKRDEEAGGPGLGVLETRKRTRRAGDGSIVTRPPKRQTRPVRAFSSLSSMSPDKTSSSSSQSPSSVTSSPSKEGPISPPTSTNDPASALSLDDPETDPMLAPMMPGGPYEPYVEPIPGQFDAADGSWGVGDFFGLDTATDFNLPFAATHNYNWLFDVASLDDAFYPLDLAVGADLAPVPVPLSVPVVVADSIDLPDPLLNLPLDLDLNGIPPVPFDQDGSAVLLQAASYVERTSSPDRRRAEPSLLLHDLDWMGPATVESSLAPTLPRLTDAARRGILSLLTEYPVQTQGSPLLSLPSLQNYCDLFFTRFNTTYPLLHTPTFNPNTIDPLFLASILSMGATYSSRDAHQLAVRIHDGLRPKLFCHPAFSPSPDLWVLQAMLLIDCFGKMRAGPQQRENAQLFHCVLIKLIRRSTCCSIRSASGSGSWTTAGEEGEEGKEGAWRTSMDSEMRKRLAFQCFMWDTQHAVLFSQSLCMSAFEIRSCLPCSPSAWEAPTASDWARQVSKDPGEPSFLSVLKGYITPGAVSRPRDLNLLSRLVILHGLMSVAADLKRRDQTTLRGETPERVGAWTPRMGRAYDLWKADCDADWLAMKLGGALAGDDARRVTAGKTAMLALYRAASLALHVEVLDLQIAAGAPSILGRMVTNEDRERSRRAVNRWSSSLCSTSGSSIPGGISTPATTAAKHAACLLQEALLSLHDWEQTDAFHFPWCLYLATLTCWAFHLRGSETGRLRIPADLSSLIVAMTTCPSVAELASLAGQYETRALVRGMAQQLATVRWAVVHEAMKVLIAL